MNSSDAMEQEPTPKEVQLQDLAEVLEQAIAEWQDVQPMNELLRSFRFQHLPMPLRAMSAAFADVALAVHIHLVAAHKTALADAARLGMPPIHTGRYYQAQVSLQKLLEAKDAAVRSVLP